VERPIEVDVTFANIVNRIVRDDHVAPLFVDITTWLAKDAKTMDPSGDVEMLSHKIIAFGSTAGDKLHCTHVAPEFEDLQTAPFANIKPPRLGASK